MTGLFFGNNLLPAQSYIFSTAGATGEIGPTQGQLNTAYASTNLNGQVTSSGGIQFWTVPTTGPYKIEAFGGQGYGQFGGRGAQVSGEFNLLAGTVLKILVGQQGGDYLSYPSTTYNHQFGGGGGSFVTDNSNNPYVVAGGGGGNHGASFVTTCDGQITTSGASGANGSIVSAGGTGGNGGAAASSADAGGGLLGNGAGTAGGKAFVNGGNGGFQQGRGGFGGGGGTSSWNNYRGGGGGGYSGGGAGNNGGACCPAGGGGGSFNAGTNQVMNAGVNLGDGSVIITLLILPNDDAGIDAINGFMPPVCKGNYPVEVVVRNYGANQINGVTVGWTVNGTPQTDTTFAALLDTAGGSSPDSMIVTIGSVFVDVATDIKIWTKMPNSVNDSSNFNDTMEVNIAAPAVVSTMLDADASCNGYADGGVSAMAMGGTSPYSYLWSNSDTGSTITNLAAGSYTVTVTDSDGCTDTSTTVVSEPTVLTASAVVNQISCNGADDGEIFLNPSGGTPGYTVVWDNTTTSTYLTDLTPGNYQAVVTDAHGCTYMQTFAMAEPPAITLSTSVTDESAPGNGAIDLTVSGGTSPYTYLWSNGGGTEDLTGLVAGSYSVTVTDANGCTASTSATVTNLVGVDGNQVEFSLNVYPNPSSGKFTVEIGNSADKFSIEVMDVQGKQLRFIEKADHQTVINLNVEAGLYLVRISNGTQSVSRRVLIQN
ncbi:MAG: T9SS type A sorting domain-containing protein [Bacteroidia bacterium]|nr:T9SS type A sorting domain-containing protein [Bacteroidia bacterium]